MRLFRRLWAVSARDHHEFSLSVIVLFGAIGIWYAIALRTAAIAFPLPA